MVLLPTLTRRATASATTAATASSSRSSSNLNSSSSSSFATKLRNNNANTTRTKTQTPSSSHLPISALRYRPKKVWPPDFAKLSRREQFRFERRYKRRVRLATARPRWDRWVRLAQLGSVAFVLIYSVLFMDWNTEKQPFEWIRNQVWGAFGSQPPGQRHERNSRENPSTSTAADRK
ncbi:hypothetical protein F4778DRAFT_783454 [Xylariomycetidae sp. FL2044]|nr:hypothetical protein F4778DRAFT_783454 [Xylariomycetidae sp. FL2044]